MTRPQGFIRNSGIQWQEELFQPFTRSCHIPPSALPYHLSSPGLGVKLLELEDEHSSMPPENYTHKPAADFSPPNKLNQLTGASQDHWDWHKNKVGPHSQNSGKQDSWFLPPPPGSVKPSNAWSHIPGGSKHKQLPVPSGLCPGLLL